MAHHVTERFPTRPLTECGTTCRISADGPDETGRWFHMCGKDAGHLDLHVCGECGAWWL